MLNPQFKVRLFDFSLNGQLSTQTGSLVSPPYFLRCRFDERSLTTGSSVMTNHPTWDADLCFDYAPPSIEALVTRFLTIEVFAALDDRFLGACRVTLHDIATGPKSHCLSVVYGRELGTLNFSCAMELITEVTLQFTNVSIRDLPMLGYDNVPSPYLSFQLQQSSSGEVRESAIARSARAPEWSSLPPLYLKGTFAQLTTQRVQFVLKNSRNGFSQAHTDPIMSIVDLDLSSLPIEGGRNARLPFRLRVHTHPGFQYDISAEMSGWLELRNVHSVVQMASGRRTDQGVQRMEAAAPSALAYRTISPPRSNRGAAPPVMLSSAPLPPSPLSYHHAAPSLSSAAPVVPPFVPPPMPPVTAPMPPVIPQDMQLLDEASSQQQALLQRVEGYLAQVARRKAELTQQMSLLRESEEGEIEAASLRKTQLDSDLRNALADKDRLELHLRQLQVRREEEAALANNLATERDRAKRALEEEQQEALQMQQRVVQLRNEIARHLQEEEYRYKERVREADEAKRRAQQNAEQLASLELRMTEAEQRASMRSKEEYHRSSTTTTTRLSSPPRYR